MTAEREKDLDAVPARGASLVRRVRRGEEEEEFEVGRKVEKAAEAIRGTRLNVAVLEVLARAFAVLNISGRKVSRATSREERARAVKFQILAQNSQVLIGPAISTLSLLVSRNVRKLPYLHKRFKYCYS